MPALPFVIEDRGYRTPCWIWRGWKINGYGRAFVRGHKVVAHKAVYEEVVGPVPEGHVLDHLCEQPACVNPEHVEPVTHTENCRRGRATKLTFAQAQEVKRSIGSAREVGERFGISGVTVQAIRSGRLWVDA